MPKECLVLNCRECEWHIVREGRLLCNYGNRLGLKKPTMVEFTSTMKKDVIDEKKKEQILEEAKKLKEALEKLGVKEGEL